MNVKGGSECLYWQESLSLLDCLSSIVLSDGNFLKYPIHGSSFYFISTLLLFHF